ncbi:MAG: hypothetical protein Q7W30_06510 [Coriobacteriia bacterium]|nr:hypothetical protein [Coriobacteriia bacterium]
MAPATAVAIVLSLTGCVGPATVSKPVGTTADTTLRTVIVQERHISSVLTLDAVVAVNPFIRIAAPSSGVLQAMSAGRVGIVSERGHAAKPVSIPTNTAIVSLLAKPGVRVSKGLPLINARLTGFALQAVVAPDQIYRLYDGVHSAQGQVDPGTGPFGTTVLGVPYPVGSITLPDETSADEAAVASDATTTPRAAHSSRETSSFPVVTTSPGGGSIGVTIIAPLPTGATSIEGLPGRIALVTAETTALVLPIEAVAGIAQEGQVYVMQRNVAVLRNVTLGITDGSYVEITSGLVAGDVVRIPSPTILRAKQ